MKRLQVFLDNEWEYVFCRNELEKDPVITKDKQKALKGDDHCLKYFEIHFGNHEFRISNN